MKSNRAERNVSWVGGQKAEEAHRDGKKGIRRAET